ncbi:hypothetical protein AURDEDRAFT_166085 [Auricularia subglabra TFB-10046 SS5]|nr:hypothetical protein AURDEDRAFT_166085 [Auricularia subglabra TFB-10046 SS5]
MAYYGEYDCIVDIDVMLKGSAQSPFELVDENRYYLIFSFAPIRCYIAAFTWVLFDYSLTLHDEIVYIWKRPMRSGTIQFYVLRYLGIISLAASLGIYLWPKETHADATECPPGHKDPPYLSVRSNMENVIFVGAPVLQFSVFWVVEVILQTRIFALYDSRRLAIVNGALFVLEIMAMLLLWNYIPAIWSFPEYHDDLWTLEEPIIQGCSYLPLYWLPGIVFELWLAGLAIAQLRRKVPRDGLLAVMVRDSVRYFFLIAIVMVVHIVTSFSHIGAYGIPFVIAGQTIGGSRIVLHLRRAYFKGRDFDMTKMTQIDLPSSAARRAKGVTRSRSRFADETFCVQEESDDATVTARFQPEDITLETLAVGHTNTAV